MSNTSQANLFNSPDFTLARGAGRKKLGTSKSTKNTGKPWQQMSELLRKLAQGNTPTRVISLKLGRTEDAGPAKASEKGISLEPTNQAPYNRRK